MGIQVKETKPNNFVGYVAKFILYILKSFMQQKTNTLIINTDIILNLEDKTNVQHFSNLTY